MPYFISINAIKCQYIIENTHIEPKLFPVECVYQQNNITTNNKFNSADD